MATITLTHPDSDVTITASESHAAMYETQGWLRPAEAKAAKAAAAK